MKIKIPSSQVDAAALGTYGDIIADTSEHTGPYFALQAIGGDAVVSAATLSDHWSGSLDGVTLTNGVTYLIPVEKITLTSGTIAAAKTGA